ncbi:hypothetical protein K469DRAFT_694287 [Zopfia rhizophila CBS 207.26]|uniref:Uncharacterized protein n=1 Tax=Zopfia rhizophila CBS 207.26 TaxID=1314779 RepID=A0A6A6EPX8_9PEZI|nr:hypothetical protein K469DRAFT_694034 [Zopfia rhizophila CBS 207.26]KAF2192140.1 hypothetical protein K469DRAFT_694287 [Zopfia rhizophila CBS 207.26]
MLSSLSWFYEEMYEYTQNSDALEYDLARAKECVQLTPASHPWRALRLGMLGNIYEQNLGAPGAIYKSRAACHRNLANKLWLRYKHNGRPEDLAEAILLGEKTASLSSYNEGQTALNINSWAGFVSDSERPEDMERAVKLFARALGTTPMHHPYDSLIFQNLANTVFWVWRVTFEEMGKQHWAAAISEAMSVKSLEEVLSKQKTDAGGGNEEQQYHKRTIWPVQRQPLQRLLEMPLDHWLHRSVSEAIDNAYLKDLQDVLQLSLFAWQEIIFRL